MVWVSSAWVSEYLCCGLSGGWGVGVMFDICSGLGLDGWVLCLQR